MKKLLIFSVITITILLAAFAVYFYYPRNIDLDAQGIKYRLGNEEYKETVQIHVHGQMHRSFNGERTFKGTIDIEGEEMPVPEDQRELEINFRHSRSGIITYAYFIGGGVHLYPVGSIYVNNDFSKFTIAVLDKEGDVDHWDGDSGLMITAPATSRQEALRISNELMNEYIKGYQLK